MEFIAMGLTNCELDVYVYARSKEFSHAEAVAVLWRNREKPIEAVELDGTVYTIAQAATAGTRISPFRVPDPWEDALWKRRWKRLLKEQHPQLTEEDMPGFYLEFTEEQPSAMDVMIAPSPVMMLVWEEKDA